LNNSSPGQAVYDPFLGSGTTLIAAETVGRICLAIELEPFNVDVAVRRWQAFTGQSATLAAGEISFQEVAAQRGCDAKHGSSGSSAVTQGVAANRPFPTREHHSVEN
jgi:hypothetical protein